MLADQVPRLDGPYDVGALYVGVNDTRGTDWDPVAFRRDVAAILAALAAACDRVVVVAPPHDLGRPPAGAKPREAGDVLREEAARTGAVVADLRDFGGARHVLPDAVHPTSLGMVAIADAAAARSAPPRPRRRSPSR